MYFSNTHFPVLFIKSILLRNVKLTEKKIITFLLIVVIEVNLMSSFGNTFRSRYINDFNKYYCHYSLEQRFAFSIQLYMYMYYKINQLELNSSKSCTSVMGVRDQFRLGGSVAWIFYPLVTRKSSGFARILHDFFFFLPENGYLKISRGPCTPPPPPPASYAYDFSSSNW